MLHAPIFDSLSFDPFSLLDDGLRPAEGGIGRCDVVQALMIARMVVMLDERFDLSFETAGEEIIFQKDAIIECVMPALELTLRLACSGLWGGVIAFTTILS